jgi:type VI secretion system protein ImpK
MTPEFAKAVDPVFQYVIDLLERISADESVSAKDERVQIRTRLDQAEALLGHGPDWQLAKYALVTWIDEVLIEAPWTNGKWWKENTLEWEDFKSSDAYEGFYLKAKESSALKRKDALEVFYVCAVLGFRGLYRDPAQAATLVEPLELPPDLESWAKQTAMAIQLGRGRPGISDASVPIEGAPPMDGPFVLIWASVVGLVLAMLSVFLVILLFFRA